MIGSKYKKNNKNFRNVYKSNKLNYNTKSNIKNKEKI